MSINAETVGAVGYVVVLINYVEVGELGIVAVECYVHWMSFCIVHGDTHCVAAGADCAVW